MAILDRSIDSLTRHEDVQRAAARRAEVARIERDLREAFELSPFPPLRAVRAAIRGDVVELRGRVRTYFHKQVAQQAAMELLERQATSLQVVNLVEVVG